MTNEDIIRNARALLAVVITKTQKPIASDMLAELREDLEAIEAHPEKIDNGLVSWAIRHLHNQRSTWSGPWEVWGSVMQGVYDP